MADNDGFLYYYDLMGLSLEDYRLHLPFYPPTNPIKNVATQSGTSGFLNFSGDFYSKSGAGMFTGQRLSLNNPTGLASDNWTHLIVFDKISGGRGIFFDSLSTGLIYSGYTLGINDANRLYFESYDDKGYSCRSSDIVLGHRNCVAFVKSSSSLNFYVFDAPHNSLLSSSAEISSDFTRFSSNISIGIGLGDTKYPINAYIDDYVYLSEGLNPSSLLGLVTGLFSEVSTTSGTVTGITTSEITGYVTGQYSYSGVTGHRNIITGSGQNPFGIWEHQYQTVPLTGLIFTGGLVITPLTGNVTYNFTGDAQTSVVFNESLVTGMTLNEVSFIRQLYPSSDQTFLVTSSSLRTGNLNLVGEYDLIEARFQLDDIYSGVYAYLNGIAGVNLGIFPTGTGYNTGIALSGTYHLTGFYAQSQREFLPTDSFVYDTITHGFGIQSYYVSSGMFSGNGEAFTSSSPSHIFLNGVLLREGQEYNREGSFTLRWLTNLYSGATGVLVARGFPISPNPAQSGLYFTPAPFQRTKSQLFLNGQRQLLNYDYIENDSFDLIGQTGLFENSLVSIYNNISPFFE